MPNVPNSRQRPWLPDRKPFERTKSPSTDPQIDKQFYWSSTWKKLRAKKMKANPLCQVCERDLIIKSAQVVDHIKPSRIYPELMEDWSNLQSLCERHHNIKSQIETYIKTPEQFEKFSVGRGAKLFIGNR